MSSGNRLNDHQWALNDSGGHSNDTASGNAFNDKKNIFVSLNDSENILTSRSFFCHLNDAGWFGIGIFNDFVVKNGRKIEKACAQMLGGMEHGFFAKPHRKHRKI